MVTRWIGWFPLRKGIVVLRVLVHKGFDRNKRPVKTVAKPLPDPARLTSVPSQPSAFRLCILVPFKPIQGVGSFGKPAEPGSQIWRGCRGKMISVPRIRVYHISEPLAAGTVLAEWRAANSIWSFKGSTSGDKGDGGHHSAIEFPPSLCHVTPGANMPCTNG